MENIEIYNKIENVKIIAKKIKSPYSVEQNNNSWFNFIYFGNNSQPEEEISYWVVIYNKYEEEYIVTNKIEEFGLNDVAEYIDLIGHAYNLDYAFYIIYEHQKYELKLDYTVYDEIKKIKNELILNNYYNKKIEPKSEWGWNNKKEKLNKEKSKITVKFGDQILWTINNEDITIIKNKEKDNM